jgi:hypothetical protein
MSPLRSLWTTFVAFIVLLTCQIVPSSAQEGAFLSLESDTTDLKTGQFYDVRIRIDGVTDFWSANINIAYDSSLIYVVGTRSGSPVQQGEFFSPGPAVVLRDFVKNNLITYTVSLLAPAEPLNGGGVIGTFRIYPLAPGSAPILFSQADLVKVKYVETDTTTNRVPEAFSFTPVLLDLTITGDPVEPPPEATATPVPTLTPSPDVAVTDAIATVQPTLVNVTAAPRTPTQEATLAPDTTSQGGNSTLTIALIVLGISGIVLLLLGLAWLRSRRK